MNPSSLDEPKMPSRDRDWQAIDIFLFSNGQQFSPPRKYHLRSEELNWWDATLGYLARSQYGSSHALLYLYTLKGQVVKDPLELSNGRAYVAVLPTDSFIDAGYEKYVVKASRSWEKRQSKISNIFNEQNPGIVNVDLGLQFVELACYSCGLGQESVGGSSKNHYHHLQEVLPQVIETEDLKKDEAPRESYMLDQTDTATPIEETNILEKTVLNAKSEENIMVTLPNTQKIVGSIKPVEKKRPNSHPIKPTTVLRRPTTSSPLSKLPQTRGVSPIKTTVPKSSERNNINLVQTKTPIPRPKTPLNKPKKLQSNLVASRNFTLPALIVDKTKPKDVGQTTDVPQVENVDGKDIILYSKYVNVSDIPSSLVDGNRIAINGTQKKEVNSLDTVSKETKNKISDLPVIKELINATSMSGQLISTPGNKKFMSFDSTKSLNQITYVEDVNNPAPNAQSIRNSNSGKQVPPNDDLAKPNKLTSANEKPSSGNQQNPGMTNDNVERPANNDTPNINIKFTEPKFRNFNEISDKSDKEPLMVLVNKGDIISLKLNVEVTNAEGAINIVLNNDTAQTGDENTKGSHANSRVSMHDDGKSIHSNAGDNRPNTCCPGNTVVLRCACCNCYQYQIETSRNDTKPINNNDPKTYFVLVPLVYGSERFINSSGTKREGQGRARFEKGNQNAASLTELKRTVSRKEQVILTTTKTHENRPEPAERIKIQEIHSQQINVSEVPKISFVINERNEASKPVKRNISQTLHRVSEQRVQVMLLSPKKHHKSTQSDWHNVLMELRIAEDGHYTFHLPPLSTLRRYKIPPFE